MPPRNPEFWMKEVIIKLNVITLLAVHGNLLLALRHPQNLGEPRDIVLNFCKEIGEQLVLLGAMTPEQLKDAYKLESEEGTPELQDEMLDLPSGATGDVLCGINLKVTPFILDEEDKGTKKFITSSMDSEELFEMLLREAKCCACGNPMSISPHLNFVSLNKKATWKKPIWDNLMLKPVYPRIPRAIAVQCDECIENNRQTIEVIEIDGEEIRYHKVADLEDAFEITPDMVITNIRT